MPYFRKLDKFEYIYIFINDLLSNTGLAKETHIISKLENKSNWIAELNKLKISIPKDWTLTLQSTESFNSTVKTDQQGTFVKNINIYNLNNKQQKQIFTKHKCTKPYVHDYWTRVFKERIIWKSVYDFINNVIQNTKVRQMRYKLIHKIIPTNENLFTCKVKISPLCLCCGELETIEHLLLDCPYVRPFWYIVQITFQKIGFCSSLISLRNIIVGYKIESSTYDDVNIIMSYACFSIYKCYIISERRSKIIDMKNMLIRDLNTVTQYYQKRNICHNILSKFVKHLTL